MKQLINKGKQVSRKETPKQRRTEGMKGRKEEGRKKRKGKGKGTKKIKKGTKEKEGASKHMHLRPCTVNVFSTLRAFWRFAHFVCE